MKLALIAEYDAGFEPHVQTVAAIEHTAAALGIHVEPRWLSTGNLEIDELAAFDALWFAPGSPYKNLNRTLAALQFARESDVPTLGTCGGFQHMVVEYARNVLATDDAQHAEYDPYASRLIVSRLACSLIGGEIQIDFTPNSCLNGMESVDRRDRLSAGSQPPIRAKKASLLAASRDRNSSPSAVPRVFK